MRMKKTTSRFAAKLDKFFWFFLSLFPAFAYLFFCIYSFGVNFNLEKYWTFGAFMQNVFGIYAGTYNPFYLILSQLFGQSSTIFPLLSQNGGLIHFFSYLCTIEVIHVCFDVIVFIPRLAHKWISKAVQDD